MRDVPNSTTLRASERPWLLTLFVLAFLPFCAITAWWVADWPLAAVIVAIVGAAAYLLFKGFVLGRWPVALGLLALSSIPFWEVYRLLHLMRELGEEPRLLDTCILKWELGLFAVVCWIMIALLFRGRIANFLRPATVPEDQRSRAIGGLLAFAVLIGIPIFKFWGLPALMNWPVDVDDAVSTLVETLPEEDRRKLAAINDEGEAALYLHFGLGMRVRNQFGLWNGNTRLLKSVCGDEPCHPDDASGVIVDRARERLRRHNAIADKHSQRSESTQPQSNSSSD